MKMRAIWTLVVLLLLIVAVNAFNSVLYSSRFVEYYKSSEHKWVKQLQVKPKIVLLGSSTIFNNVSPREISKKMKMNEGEVICLAGQAKRPIHNYFTLESLDADDLRNVGLIIYGIDPWMFDYNYRQYDAFSISELDMKTRLWLSSETGIPIKRRLGIFLNLSNPFFTEQIKKNINKDFGVSIPEDYGGELINKKVRSKIIPGKIFSKKLGYDRSNFEYLRKIKEKYGVSRRIYFIIPPRRSDFNNIFNQMGKKGEFDQIFKNYVRSDEWLDCNERTGQFPTSDDDFFDWVHFNQSGRMKFSAQMAGLMERLSETVF